MSTVVVYRLVLACLAVLIGVLTQLEVDQDMLLADKRASMPKSRAKLFQFMADMRHLPLWYPGISSFEPSDSEPMGIGKHFVEMQTMPIIGELLYDNIITGYESPRFIGYISNAWLNLRTEMVLERQDNSQYPTQLRIKVYTRRRSYFVQYVLGPFVRHAITEKTRQSLFNLKYVLQK